MPMATGKLLLGLLRRSQNNRSRYSVLYSVLSIPNFPSAPAIPTYHTRKLSSLLPFSTSYRSFSSGPSESELTDSSYSLGSGAESEYQSVLLTDASGRSNLDICNIVVRDEDYLPPIQVVVSLLDWIHDSTGLPWWITIASSTLMLRISLFPFLVVQLHKLKRIAECIPTLPLPLPPPLSGKSYIEQFSLFKRERKAVGCPSFLWFLAFISVQVPCFFLWMTSIRRMSLDHHPGFDSGGTLWFQNLTELAQGSPGLIFPTLIASLHLLNVQITLKSSNVGKDTGLLGLLAKLYRIYLRALTVPIFFTGFLIPHGSLVYWVSNSSLNVIQHLCLQNPNIREKLGLPPEQALSPAIEPESDPGSIASESMDSDRKVPVEDLSPKELVALSVLSLSRGNKDEAVPFLRLALDKDPEYVRALTIMGQTLLQKGQEVEAIEYLEHAISKTSSAGLPTEVEDIDLLIQASQWAGVACIRQGKLIDGRIHLERAASMEEPEDPKSKAHYYDGLVLLSSALVNEGRKSEAIEYLRKAAAYNPEFKVYLEQCEKETDGFVDDLVSSRRGDY
ncbi:hypothetical protein V2J09_019805 [Rumex salicifolius]